jgi:hypothetical protein
MSVHGLIYFNRATVDSDEEASMTHHEPLAGGGRHRKTLTEVILPRHHGWMSAPFFYEYQCALDQVNAALAKNPSYVSVTTPMWDLLPYIPRAHLQSYIKYGWAHKYPSIKHGH